MKLHTKLLNKNKSRAIGETFVKPCMLKAVNLILGKVSAKMIQQAALSNKLFQNVYVCEGAGCDRNQGFSGVLFSARVPVPSCLSSSDTFIQVTLKTNSCSAVHLKPLRNLMSWKK